VRVALNVEPEDIPLNIVFEDEYIIVIDKPGGLVVHPAPGSERGTLVNALLFHTAASGASLPVISGVMRPGIVHRIDKNTSGLLVVTKSDFAHRELAKQFAAHTITRVYSALAVGPFADDEGSIDLPTGRDPADRKKQKALNGSYDIDDLPSGFRRAVTHWRVIERLGSITLLELRLETGRTHQIRVHLSSIGRPVLGDDLYGPLRTVNSNRRDGESQYLHAGVLGFIHPVSKKYEEFTSPLPEKFVKMYAKLKKCMPR
jgi:23S rRNA pseudouridine1911/1915/1917 synthase